MTVRRGLVALMLAYAFTTGGAAGQEAEVRSAISKTLATWAAGDFSAFAALYSPDVRGFFLDGGYLVEGINAPALQAGYDAGIRASFELRDLEVRMVGGVALAAGYLDGSLTLPGGEVKNGTWRYTETRAQEGEAWKVIQFHFSEMTTALR